ncbi:alpha/beta fold hydrolase [Runella slithyformis]|uniref:Alpha/beta hydrolase fold protein n=1 Tax=Runella slithyformis (strain ATCC 29530 / DSM 19594 / LMG 11500 / NCIMB 11436 / LSU 4) TaxID=761193 RepID=A0A7U4E5J4_RUNSL|nr:alpha/beta hydrolase [Runella slithyformis]AEI48399.1 alpha/beta hydrolase fold protein [Runella slithyformis DSM 19594]
MKTLVLIHGHGIDASIWEDIKPLLEDFQVLTPDFSTDTTYKSIEEYADGLYEWLGDTGVKKCVLIGHSMGGYLTLAFAEKYPEMLQGFGLFHSTAYADDEAKTEQRKKTLTFMETHGAAAFIRQSAPNMYSEAYAKENPDVIKSHVEKYAQLPTEAVIAGFKAIMNRPDRTAILRDTNLPVLLIFGEQDKLISFEKNIDLSKLSPNSHTLILKEAGHMGMVEDAKASAEEIREFMEAV